LRREEIDSNARRGVSWHPDRHWTTRGAALPGTAARRAHRTLHPITAPFTGVIIMSNPQPFYLLATSNTGMAIQAGAADGKFVTLQNFNASEPLQQWIMQAQVSGGGQGVALVNAATGNSITGEGNYQNVVMQPYSPGSDDPDAFLLLQGDGSGNVRIAQAGNSGFSLNDRGGGIQPGDYICLWDDAGANSVWTIQLVTGAQIAVPAIVGESAGATA
jgi:hypothetical protein